jgi:hypothetical protein
MPCGPFQSFSSRLLWQAVHSPIVPAWPCAAMLCRLSFSSVVGQIACGEPWQAEHSRSPWPVLKR